MNVWIRKGGRRKGSVKEGYEGEEAYGRRALFFRVLLDLLVESLSSVVREGSLRGAPVCWGFWAWGPGYPYGVLELGICPSWQGGNMVWAELISASSWARQQQEGQQDKHKFSIRPRYFNLRICFMHLRNMKFYKVVCKLLFSAQ
jgi:hypothetical protein